MIRFDSFNPAASAVWFLSVLIISMFSQNFILLLLSFAGAALCLIVSKGLGGFMRLFGGCFLMFLTVAAVNPVFSHNGVTPLFFVNDVAITYESVIYGAVLGLEILCTVLWFSAVNIVFTSERLMYLFGKLLPGLALMFSMVLRFVPRFLAVFGKIRSAQAQFKHRNRLSRFAAAFSSTVTVSLENSVGVSSSMESRGYGLLKRSFYCRFRFTPADAAFVAVTLALFGASAAGVFSGELDFLIYPKIVMPSFGVMSVISYISFGALSLMPFAIETREGIKWKRSLSKI